MSRTIQTQLLAQAGKITELERVLQLHLQQPALPPAPRTWLMRTARLFTALFAAQTLLAGVPAYAQITAAPGAVAGQKPLIDAAANGTPIVLIAPPSRAGVSRNLYDQLNVGPKGLILNNATAPVQTQLGGWITGNLQLGQNPARIILNEVTGANASQLRGYIEVGGQRADLVIANPNGITCDGCGFLNANRATLTTGRPQFGFEGALTGLDVRQGVISVGPGGLDATEQQQLDIIARGLLAEGEVFTQKLKAIIGANQVVYGTLESAPQSGAGDAPRFAIDIKDLGGMHAGQIFLIATDKGLGVNSTGRMSTLAGNLELSVNGELTLKDSNSANDLVLVGTGQTTLTGQTLAQGKVQIDAPVQLVNSGALQAATLEINTPRIDNSGSMAQFASGAHLALTLPGGLANSGAIYTPGDLSVRAASVTGASTLNAAGAGTGSLSAGGAMTIAAPTLDLRGQQLAANQDIRIQAHDLRATASTIQSGGQVILQGTGAVDLTGTTVVANSSALVTGESIALDRSQVAAQGDVQLTSRGQFSANAAGIASNAAITVQAASISMSAGSVTAATTASLASGGEIRLEGSVLTAGERLSMSGQGVSTAGATVAAPRIAIEAGAGALNNQGGKVLASSTASDALTLHATGIDNKSGELRANGGLTLDAQGGRIDNSQGVIAGATGTLTHLGSLTNRGGVIYTESDLHLAATALDNSAGAIVTRGNLSVTTPGQAIENAGGLLQAGGAVTLDAGSAALNNAAGSVISGGALSIQAGALDTTAGTLTAGAQLDVTVDSLAGNSATLGSGGAMNINVAGDASLNGGTVDAAGNLTVNAGTIHATGATAKSNANTQVTAVTITGGSWQAQGDVTATAQGALDLTGGGLIAVGNATATGQGITTDNAQVSGQTVTLDAGAGTLSNQGGKVNATAASGAALNITASGINNAGGTLASRADAVINAGNHVVDNTGGTIQVDGNLQLVAGQLVNRTGAINTGSSLTFQGFALDNNAGTIQTKGDLTIDTAGQLLDNTAGQLKADGHTTLTAGTVLGNGGTISAGTSLTDGKLTVRATSMEANNARLSGSRELDILVTQRLALGGSTLETGGKLTAVAATIDTQGATLNAVEALSVQATGALDMGGASVKTGDELTVSGTSVAAAGATLSAGGNAQVTATSGAATLDRASLLAAGTARVTAIGIAASAAVIGAVGQVTLQAGTGDFTAPNVLVQSQDAGITLDAATVNAAGSTPAGATPTTGLLAAQAIAITATGAVDVSRAVTAVGTSIDISSGGAIVNEGGRILARSTARLDGATLHNQGGIIDAADAVAISVSAGQVVNDQGRISTRGVLAMTAPGGPLVSLSNAGGIIDTTGALNLQLRNFNNSGGSVTALTGLTIAGGPVTNTAGLLASQGNVSIDTHAGALAADRGEILSTQGNVSLTTGAATLEGGGVRAQGAVTITGTSINASDAVLQANTGPLAIDMGAGAANLNQAQLLSGGDLTLIAGDTGLNNSTVVAGGHTHLTTGALQASQAVIDTQGDFSVAAGGAVTADQAQIAAGGGASITSTSGIDLNHGSVQAPTLELKAGSGAIDNTAGTLIAAAAAGTALTLQSQGLLNDGGTMASGADLSIDAGAGHLANAAGTIVAVGAAQVRSTGLTNIGGTIASNGTLTINAAQANALTRTDNTRGTIRSAQSGVHLTTGELINSRVNSTDAGSLITAATSATVHATGPVDNARSEISAATGDLTITASGLLTNNQGRLTAGRNAALTASAIGNNSGLIAGNEDAFLTTTAGGVTNTSGAVQAANNLTLSATGPVANDSGKLLAGASLALSGGALTNSAGEISAQSGSATLTVTSYSNAAGSILAGSALSLDTQGGELTANGSTFASGAGMSLRGGAAQFNDASVTAGGSLDAQVTSLAATRATVQAAGQLTVHAGTGELSAANSAWKAGQGIALTGGNTTLTDSTLAGNGAIAITGANIDASRASITSPGDVRVIASGALHIGNATLLAGRDLTATGTGAGTTAGATAMAGRDLELGNGAAFDFSAPDLQYSFNRNLTVRAQGINTAGLTVAAQDLTLDAGAGQLNNQGGTLNATGNLSVSGTGLDNRSGVIAANGDLTASARSGALDNASGQIYSTQASAAISGASIRNATGIISAATDIALSGGTLENTGNTIAAGRNLTANLTGQLTNTGGRIIANTGAASLTASGIENTNGVIAGITGATADAGSGTLTNTGGQVSGQAVVIGGQVANSAGVISGLHSVAMTTRAIDNDAGVIESGAGGITINTQGSALVNTHSGTTRGIVSTGAITIDNAGAIDNQSGYIGASGGLNITGSASIDNRQGALLGLGASSVHTTGLLDNRGGNIKSNASLTVGAGTLDNSGANSVVFANGDLSVTAGHIDNSNTKNGAFTTGLLAAGNLSVTAGTVDNTNGAIVALGDTSVKATTSLTNTQGQIAGNTVTIETPVLTNTGGRADAQQRMSVKVPQFSADGVLASNGAMELHLKGDYTNNGTVSSNGDLVISTDGTYTNYKDISAKENLHLSAATVINGANGVIGSQKTTITAQGEVINEGLINSTSEVTTINAAGVRNVGRIYGDHINLSAALVQNGANAAGKGAAIASRLGSVAVYGSLVNTGNSLVYSSGSLNVTGAVTNVGASLNAQGSIDITGHLDNRNANFVTGLQTTSEPASGVWITPAGSTQRYSTAELGWRHDTGGRWVLPSQTYPISAFGAALMLPVASCYSDNDGYSCYGYNYTTSDPVWARFGIGSPDSVPGPGPAPQGNGCMISSDVSIDRDMEGACGSWWAAVDTHTATVLSRYSQLESAIAAFNADLEARSLIDWYETTLTGKTVVKTYVVASDPGIVVAAGDITLRGGNTNIDSRIYAGGSYSGSPPQATYGTSQTTEEGTMVFSHRTWSGGFSQSYGRQVSAPQPIAYPPITESIKLPIDETPAPYAPETTTPLGAGAATVPVVGPIVTSARNANGAGLQNAATHTGTPTTQTGNTVTVDTTTTDAPQTATGPSSISADSGDTVSALTSTGPVQGATAVLTTDVNVAPAPILPGSVIAATVRADQLASISTSLAKFAVLAAAVPQVAQSVDTSARQAGLPPLKEAGYITVKSSALVLAPNNQLYILNRSPRGPLVETDPAFTGYRNFLSSAWFLAQLNLDPERTLKLYGDGFAEQRLIDDQIMALTGRRFLSNYTSSEDQYQDLLNAGVMFAQKYQLTPGVALSAEQMATLTTDIVWLETRTVTLPDGSTTEALVPTVYLRRLVDGDITPIGSLVSARNITVRSAGDVMNGGTVYAYGDAAQGDGKLTIEGQNVGNTGTLAGNVISITAQNTINNAGGVIQGLGDASSASLNARDIILRTTTQTSDVQIEGPNGTSTGTGTNVDRIATISADSVTMTALGDITLSGAVVSATGELNMNAGGNITSNAVATGYTLHVPMGGGGAQGRSSYYSATETTQQLSTLAGNNVAITAQGDATFKGTNATAVNDLTVTGKNVTIESDKNSLAIDQQGVHKSGFERVAKADEALTGGVFASGNNTTLIANGVKADGQGNITTTGATIVAASGQASLIANNNVTIQNATTEHSQASESHDSSKGFLSKKSTQQAASNQTTQVNAGSVIGNTVLVQAGNDVTLRASQITATNDAQINAGRDVNIVTSEQLQTGSSFFEQKKSGLDISLTQIAVGKSAQDQSENFKSTTQVGSSVSGSNVNVTAGRDANITASNVLADKDITVNAGRNINLTAATDTRSTQTEAHSSATTFNLSGTGGLGGRVTVIGVNSASQDGTSVTTSQQTSLLSANAGNLTLNAGTDNQYRGTGQGNVTSAGATLLAKGEVGVTGNRVDLGASQDSSEGISHAQSKSFAVGAALAGVVGSQITAIGDKAAQAADTSNSRLQSALVLKGAFDAYKLADSAARQVAATDALAQSGGDPNGAAFAIQATISYGKNSQDTTQTTTRQTGTTIQADSIVITSRDTDINAVGAKLQAADITMDAAGAVNLRAAVNTTQVTSSNSGSNVAAGVTFGLGGQNGISFQLAAGQQRGNANGSETTYDNTLVTATDKLVIKSGGDTNLTGAQIGGKRVEMDVKGNLNIQTLQDTSNYESEQSRSGFNVSVCVPPLCYGTMVSGSVSTGKQGIDHSYESATGQSGVAAGTLGFDIKVGGTTTLQGGALTSEAPKEQNNLSTARLVSSDLVNTQNTDSTNKSLTLGWGGASVAANVGSSVASNVLGNSLGGAGLPDSGSQSGATKSVISPASITITSNDAASVQTADTLTSRDAGTANESLKNTLTLQQAQVLQDQQKVAQENAVAAQLVGSVLTEKVGDLSQGRWADGSPEKTALHGLAGIVTAKIAGTSIAAGATAGAINELMLPLMEEYLVGQGYVKGTPQFQALLIAGSALVGAGTGAITGGTGTGALVAVNATVNNYLTHAQWNEYAAELDACSNKAGGCSGAEQAALRQEYTTLSDQQNAALATCTTNCAQLTKDVAAGTAQMLVLIGQDKLSGVTGSTINDLGQNIGQNLASNPTLRAQVSDALAVKALCVSNPSACDRQALAAAALVVLPILGVAGGVAAMEALIAAGRLGAAELGLFKTMGPTAYCSVNPIACLAAVETSAGILTGTAAPSVLPLGPVTGGASRSMVKPAETVVVEVAATARNVEKGLARGVTEVSPSSPLVMGGGLQVYEDAGGHLIARHVGLSHTELAERLATSTVPAASTFTNRAVAEAAVSAALEANLAAVTAYVRANTTGYLAVEFSSSTVVGVSLLRDAATITPVSNVRVVIARDPTMSTGFRIVTGYPY